MERIRKYGMLWGSWCVKKIIGEGSFGAVYEVEKNVEGNISYSAVKLISINNAEMLQNIYRNDTMSTEELKALKRQMAKKSVREAALMNKLQGRDNIVTIYDYDIYPGEKTTDVIIRMELLKNLNEYLTDIKSDENLVIELGIDLCKALEICEEERIVHRDIKPANIFVNKDKHFKLGDFGLSRQMSKSASMSLRKTKGTPLYMPPEAFGWDNYVDHTSDIYSLALVMYQLLNHGKIPFCSDMSDFDELNIAIGKRVDAKEQIPAPEGCREELWNVIQKACAPEKIDRYQNAIEMRKALEVIKNKLELEKSVEIRNKKIYDDQSSHGVYTEEDCLRKAQEAWNQNHFEKALQFYEKAAKLGNAEAQNALGHCYYKGYGKAENEEKALYWFGKAEVQGHMQAKNIAEMIRKKRKEEQMSVVKETKPAAPVSETKSVSDKTYNVGDIITFGTYPNNKNLSAGRKSLEWIVLKKEVDKILVISKKVLENYPYHKKCESTTWETSDIRCWLNKYFYETAFNTEEQVKIKEFSIKSDDNVKYDKKQKSSLIDKLFLLSIDEVNNLFLSDKERKGKAASNVWSMSKYDSGYCCWWLRSTGGKMNRAAIITVEGYVDEYGHMVNDGNCGVRPAMWIAIKS